MKLLKKLLIFTLIGSMTMLIGCGKEVVNAEITNTPEIEGTVSPEITVTPEETIETTPTTDDVVKESSVVQATDALAEEPKVTVDTEGLEPVSGITFSGYIPSGWVKASEQTVPEGIDSILVLEKGNAKITISEQYLEDADTYNLPVVLQDTMDNYNAIADTTGIKVNKAGDKNFSNINVGYMEYETCVTEEMLKTSLEQGKIVQAQIDSAGGVEKYLKSINKKQLQLYVPNRSEMITIVADLLEGEEKSIEEDMYYFAQTMELE